MDSQATKILILIEIFFFSDYFLNESLLITFVQGSVVERFRLQSHVSRGQNEGKGGQSGRVQSRDRSERDCPSHSAGTGIVSIKRIAF